MKELNFVTIIFFAILIIACNTDRSYNDNRINYLGSEASIRLEQENIQSFFNRHDLELEVSQTKNVDPYRIFLHTFTSSNKQIRQIIEILELDSVTYDDFKEIHTDEFVNVDFKVHSPIGFDYLKDSLILFYKGENSNHTVEKELKVSKVYLFYNRETREACFQVYYEWG